MLDHRIEDDDQFANTGGQRQLMLFADPAQRALNALPNGGIARLLTAITLGADDHHQLLTAAHQLLQFLVRFAGYWGRRRLELFAEAAQSLRVDAIGFGQLPAGLGKVVSIARINPRISDPADHNPSQAAFS